MLRLTVLLENVCVRARARVHSYVSFTYTTIVGKSCMFCE